VHPVGGSKSDDEKRETEPQRRRGNPSPADPEYDEPFEEGQQDGDKKPDDPRRS
jgi:hypothetical protein